MVILLLVMFRFPWRGWGLVVQGALESVGLPRCFLPISRSSNGDGYVTTAGFDNVTGGFIAWPHYPQDGPMHTRNPWLEDHERNDL